MLTDKSHDDASFSWREKVHDVIADVGMTTAVEPAARCQQMTHCVTCVSNFNPSGPRISHPSLIGNPVV